MCTAPSLFLFSTIQISIHLALTLGVGKLFGFQRRDLLLASNANVGGKDSCNTKPCSHATHLLWVAWLGSQIAVFLVMLILCQGSLQLQELYENRRQPWHTLSSFQVCAKNELACAHSRYVAMGTGV